MNILFTIDADEAQDGEQVIVDGDALENITVREDPNDMYKVIIKGYSEETGDIATHVVAYNHKIDVWAL